MRFRIVTVKVTEQLLYFQFIMGVAISNDTIQRLYDRIEFKDNPDVEAVGVGDVAT